MPSPSVLDALLASCVALLTLATSVPALPAVSPKPFVDFAALSRSVLADFADAPRFFVAVDADPEIFPVCDAKSFVALDAAPIFAT
jgi:hypothetical protein